MLKLLFCVHLICINLYSMVNCKADTSYEQLMENIMQRSAVIYKTPPWSLSDNSSLSVNVSFYPLDIIQFSDVDQYIKVKAYIFITWQHPALTWNASDYDDIKGCFIDPDSIWTPEIFIEVTLTEKSSLDFPKYLILTSDGLIISINTNIISFRCGIDFDKYPFDTQTCVMITKDISNLMSINADIALSPFVIDIYTVWGEWTFVNITHEIITGLHRFNVTVRRHATYYVITIIFPLVMTSLMIPLVFLIPAMTGEKLSYLVTMFTSTAIFLNFIWSVMPRGLNNVPYLAILIIEVMMEGCAALLASFVVVNLFEAEEKEHRRSKHRTAELFQKVVPLDDTKVGTLGLRDEPHSVMKRNHLNWHMSSKLLDRICFVSFYGIQVVFLLVMFCGSGWR